MDMEVFKREVEATYVKVKSLAGWSVDKNVVLTITSYYSTSEQEFDAVSLNRAIDAIKSRSGWFSPLRGALLPIMAVFLNKPGADIHEEMDHLFAKQQVLKEVGFRNSIHSYLAAFLMGDDVNLYKKEAEHAKKLYDAMKKQHFFLTSDNDYAYAVLLGKQGADPIIHAESMKAYYNALRTEGFRSGNELQWLSQIMTYLQIDFNPKHVSRATEIEMILKRESKLRPIHYPMIGFLTIFGFSDLDLMKIVLLTHSLETAKPLKWNREMALSIAMGYVIHQLIEDIDEMTISLAASVELLMQAQQAVMTATIAAMAASSASSTSNG